MRRFMVALAAAAFFVAPATAQQSPSFVITTYRAAPGHQVELLRWLARQDEVAQAAGLPASQLYVHQDGASWDYLIIALNTTAAQDQAVEAAAQRLHATTGPRVGIELRQHIAEHTDTIVAGPTTAAAWLRRLEP